MERPVPKLLGFSDRSVQCILILLYAQHFLQSLISYFSSNVPRLETLGPDFILNGNATLRYLVPAKGRHFLGISLAPSFLSLLTNASNVTSDQHDNISYPLRTALRIVGKQCAGAEAYINKFTGDVNLISPRVALIWPVECSTYEVDVGSGISGSDMNSSGDYQLFVEADSPTMQHIGSGIRAFITVFFIGLTTYSIWLTWTLSREHRVWIGKYSTIMSNVGVVIMCNPTDVLRLGSWNKVAIVMRWLFPVALYLSAWCKLRYTAEVLADLRSALANPTPRAKDFLFRGFELASFVLFVVVSLWLSINIANLQTNSVVGLTDVDWWWVGLLKNIFQMVFFIVAITQLCVWYSRMKHAPYSKCRIHYILFSFQVLTWVTLEVTIILISFGAILVAKFRPLLDAIDDRQAMMSWVQFDDACLGMVLPDVHTFGENDAIAYALLLTFCFSCGASVSDSSRDRHRDTNAMSDPLWSDFVTDCNSVAGPMGNLVASLDSQVSARATTSGLASLSLNELRLLAHVAKSHRPRHEVEALAQVNGPPNLEYAEDDLDFTSIEFLEPIVDDELDLHAMLVKLHFPSIGRDVGVLSFRGTSNAQNVGTDLKTMTVPVILPGISQLAEQKGVSDAKVHAGFQEAFLALREQLLQSVRGLSVEMLWCVGHSLGGALATCLAGELFLEPERKFQIGLCTFGCPRPGNRAFVRLVDSSVVASVRVVLEKDPVSQMPPQLGGACGRACFPAYQYDHVTGLVRIFRNGHLVVKPTFLEELVRTITNRRFWICRLCCYCCFWLRRAPNHRLVQYIGAFRAVKTLEFNRRISLELNQQSLDNRVEIAIR